MLGALKTNLRIYFGLDDNVKFLDEEILKKKKKKSKTERGFTNKPEIFLFLSLLSTSLFYEI